MPKEKTPETIETIRAHAAKIESSLLDLTLAIEGGETRLAHRHYTDACQALHQLGLTLVLRVTQRPSAAALINPQSAILNPQS